MIRQRLRASWAALAIAAGVVALSVACTGGVNQAATGADAQPTATATETQPTPAAARPVPRNGRIGLVAVRGGRQGVYTVEADGADLRNLTAGVEFVGPAAWSDDGSMVAFWGVEARSTALYVADTSATAAPTAIFSGEAGPVSWSPDSSEIALSVRGDIFAVRVSDRSLRRITSTRAREVAPLWSPDGTLVAYRSDFADCALLGIGIAPSAGGNGWAVAPCQDVTSLGWSPDSRQLTYEGLDLGLGGTALHVVAADGSGHRVIARASGFGTDWAPDGRRIAAVTLGPENWDITVFDAAVGGMQAVTASDPGAERDPCWSPDGRYIVYAVRGGAWIAEADTRVLRPLLHDAQAATWLPALPGEATIDPGSGQPPRVRPEIGGALAPLPPGSVRDDGWPKVECGEELEPFIVPTRKIALCRPAGWQSSQVDERDEGDYRTVSVTLSPHPPTSGQIMLTVISRGGRASRSSWAESCDAPEQATLVGLPAELCVSMPGKPNGMFNYSPSTWFVAAYTETDEYMITARASGPQPDETRAAALAQALAVLASVRATSLAYSP